MKLVDLIKDGARANFVYCQNAKLYYTVEAQGKKFLFPIPMEETDGAKFLPEDKATIFQRWIRKAIDSGDLIELF